MTTANEKDLVARIEASIVSRFRTFDCGGIEIDLRPVTTMEGLLIVREFPIMRKVMFGGSDVTEETMFELLLAAGPEAIAAFVATSAGAGRDAKAREAFLSMPDDTLFDALVHAKEITMPEGPGPFFERIKTLGAKLGIPQQVAKEEAAEAEAKRASAGKRVRKAA